MRKCNKFMQCKSFKYALVILLMIILSWAGMLAFVHYKFDQFVTHLPTSLFNYENRKIYVKFGIINPISIKVKNIIINSAQLPCDIKINIHPRFSNITTEIHVTSLKQKDTIDLPLMILFQKSSSGKYYINEFIIAQASLLINDSLIKIDGSMKFIQHKLPEGTYIINITDKEKLLHSQILLENPTLHNKVKNIMDKIGPEHHNIRIDYTQNGIKISDIDLENF